MKRHTNFYNCQSVWLMLLWSVSHYQSNPDTNKYPLWSFIIIFFRWTINWFQLDLKVFTHLVCLSGWMEVTLYSFSFISLQRQVHSVSVCGGVSWGRRWGCEGGSARSHLHGRHGLWHGQLLPPGTPHTEQAASALVFFADPCQRWCVLEGFHIILPISHL